MLRFTRVVDVQVRDEDVLLGKLTEFTRQTGRDVLPDLLDAIRRVGGDEGTLFLTSDLQGTPYWTTEEPIGWPHGLIVAQWVVIADHGNEVDVI